MEYYAGAPFDLEAYRRKIEAVTARFGPAERAQAARALKPTSERARQRLERFVADGGIMVTTGQQAGLLTGPLYTIYKALTAARLAEELERRLGLLVIPVFWTASEDHDWEEVNHAYLPLERDGIRRVELPGTPDVPRPMAAIPLGEGVGPILEEISDLLIGDGDNEVLLKWIREAYAPENTVAGAFAELMQRLLEPFDFCTTDAADPEVKAASVAVLEGALEHAVEHERVLRERSERMEADGYHAQVAVLGGGTNVFREGRGGRERLYLEDGRYRAGGERATVTLEELKGQIEAEPGRFSPNVFLRPVVESTVFPTVAYVGGPGEISYFAQLSVLFPQFGIEPPLVYPRDSLLLIETPMRRLLEKLEMEVEALRRPRHELVEALAQGSMPTEVRGTLDELNRGLTEGYRTLIEQAKEIDPTLEGALARLRNEALSRLVDSERKIAQHIKRKEAVRIGQLDRLLAHLRPEGQPQDRVLNVIPFLARHGLGLLRQMYDAVGIDLRER